jgi:thioredoxin reductase (NADPH)
MAAQHHRLIIVGSGPAGYTAAVYAARAALEPVLITGVEVGGQMTTTTDVDNWPGDDRGVLGPELMERMKRHAEKFGTELIYNHVDRVELGQRPFRLFCGKTEYTCDALIVATGAAAKYLGLKSEDAKGRAYRRAPPATASSSRGQPVAVVGGGNTAVEEALYLEHRFARHRRAPARPVPRRADHDQQTARARKHGNVEILWNHVLDEVTGDERGVSGARLKHVKSQAKRDIPVQACSSRSATRRTPRCSKASSRWKAATSSSRRAERPRHRDERRGRAAAGDVADRLVGPSRRPGRVVRPRSTPSGFDRRLIRPPVSRRRVDRRLDNETDSQTATARARACMA